MSAYDAFVDGGLAKKDGGDQKATIKIIHEKEGHKFGMREGSVRPDLSYAHFQPRRLPPIPLFADAPSSTKRSREEAFDDGNSSGHERPYKSLRAPRASGEDSAIPSIERGSEASGAKDWQMVIPGTQESSLRPVSAYGAQGSVILGEPEHYPQTHHLESNGRRVSARQDDFMDVDEAEMGPEIPESPEVAKVRRRVRRSGGRVDPEAHSGSSSNYYSVSDSQEVHKLNGQPVLQERPHTPPSEISRRGRPAKRPSDQSDRDARAGSTKTPFSAKFQRQHIQSQLESDIDDTQMSPQSRKSDKRLKKNQQPAPVIRQGTREPSTFASSTSRGRSLVQNGKRSRKETVSDFGRSMTKPTELTDLDEAEAHPSRRDRFARVRKSNGNSGMESPAEASEPKALSQSKKNARTSTPSKVDAGAGNSPVAAAEAPVRTKPTSRMDDPIYQQSDDSDKENANDGPVAPLVAQPAAVMSNGVPSAPPKQNNKTLSGEVAGDPDSLLNGKAPSLDPINKLTPLREHRDTIDTEETSNSTRKTGERRKRSNLGEPGEQLSQELRASVEAVDRPVQPSDLNASPSVAKKGLTSGVSTGHGKSIEPLLPGTQEILDLMSESSADEKTEDQTAEETNAESEEEAVADSEEESGEESDESSAEESENTPVGDAGEKSAEESAEESEADVQAEVEAESDKESEAESAEESDAESDKESEAEVEEPAKVVRKPSFGEQLNKMIPRNDSANGTRSSSEESDSAEPAAESTSAPSQSKAASLTPKAHSNQQAKASPDALTQPSGTTAPGSETGNGSSASADKAENPAESESESESEAEVEDTQPLDPKVGRQATAPPAKSAISKKAASAKSNVAASTPNASASDKTTREPIPPLAVATAKPIIPLGYSVEQYYDEQESLAKNPPPPPRARRSVRVNKETTSRTPSTDRAGSGTPVPASRAAGKPSKLRDEVKPPDPIATKNATQSSISPPLTARKIKAISPKPPKQATKTAASASSKAKKSVPVKALSGPSAAAPSPLAELSSRRQKERDQSRLLSSQNSSHLASEQKQKPVVEESESESETETESEPENASEAQPESSSDSEDVPPPASRKKGAAQPAKGKAQAKQPSAKAPAKPAAKTTAKAKSNAMGGGGLVARNASAVARPRTNGVAKTDASTNSTPIAKSQTPQRSSTTKLPVIKQRPGARASLGSQMSAAATPGRSGGVDLSIRDMEPETSEDDD